MIKITFEISEDFINEKADMSKLSTIMSEPEPLLTLKDVMSFGIIKKEIESGIKEFIVTPNKLDHACMRLYNRVIGEICALATFSETDNKKE